MKIVTICMVLMMAAAMASAAECSSYFSKSDGKRDKVGSAVMSLQSSVYRLSDDTDDFFSELDDLDSSDTLGNVSDYFDTFIDDKADGADHMSDLSSAVKAYYDAIRSDDDNVPTSCRAVYNSYDDDYNEINGDYKDVKKSWDYFIEKYDAIYAYHSNPNTNKVSDIRTKVDNIRDYIDDVSSDADTMMSTADNGTTIDDSNSYNQTECYKLVTASVETAKSQMAMLCKRQLANATGSCDISNMTCPECTECQDCSYEVGTKIGELNSCLSQVTSLRNELASKPAAVAADCSSVQSQLIGVQGQLQAEKALNANLTAQTIELSQQLVSMPQCGSCLIYQAIALGLFLLILAAWILAM